MKFDVSLTQCKPVIEKDFKNFNFDNFRVKKFNKTTNHMILGNATLYKPLDDTYDVIIVIDIL